MAIANLKSKADNCIVSGDCWAEFNLNQYTYLSVAKGFRSYIYLQLFNVF